MNGIRRSLKNLLPPFLVIASSYGLISNARIRKTHLSSVVNRRVSSSIVSSVVGSESIATARTSSSSTTRLLAEPPNPFVSMLGDLASSILPGKSPLQGNAGLDSSLQKAATCSWDDIRSELESVQTPEERNFRENIQKGYGEVGSALHKVRLYDESNKESDIRITFYRDHASWCPYCQKIWFALEEKRIPYRVEKVNMNCYGNKPREFLQLQPNGQIPVAIIDGRVYGSSNDILSVLDSAFPDHKSLAPSDSSKARELLRLEQTLAGAWLGWLRSTGGGSGKQYMEDTLADVERALKESGGPFFMGKDVTIVDVQFLSFLERMSASLLYYKGFVIRVPKGESSSYPAINKWFDALEERPSYQVTKSDYYTHAWDLPPQLGGCGAEPEGEVYRKAINGENSWELPLQPHNGGIEPDWGSWANGDDDKAAKREAVERLSYNHDAIVRFASRGAGKKGMPPVMAPLADPNATPNEPVQIGIDAVLRIVSSKLLKGDEQQHEEAMIQLRNSVQKDNDNEYSEALLTSIVYLRDRIGVPRDMRLPAARQLRAHLNWAIHTIEEKTS